MYDPKRIKKTFLTGFVAILPITLTFYVLIWVARFAEDFLGSILRFFLPEGWYTTGIGVVVAVGAVFAVGLLTDILVVKNMANRFEKAIYQVPLIKSIYGAVREFISYLLHDKHKEPKQTVLVKIADKYTLIGFVTKENLDILDCAELEPELIAVYLPLSYQIGGYTVLVPPSAVTPISMPLEKAMRFVMTAGIIEREKDKPGGPLIF